MNYSEKQMKKLIKTFKKFDKQTPTEKHYIDYKNNIKNKIKNTTSIKDNDHSYISQLLTNSTMFGEECKNKEEIIKNIMLGVTNDSCDNAVKYMDFYLEDEDNKKIDKDIRINRYIVHIYNYWLNNEKSRNDIDKLNKLINGVYQKNISQYECYEIFNIIGHLTLFCNPMFFTGTVR